MPGLWSGTSGLALGTGLRWSSGLFGGSGFQNQTSFPGATLDMNFVGGNYTGAAPASLTVTRSGTNATDLTYDQTSRTSYNSFSANTARIVADGRGLLVEESRTQYLGVTDTPANQTTSSLGTGSYTLWCIGGTSVTVAAGTATITGAGSATPGTPLTFSVTVAGTVTVTVSGAVRFFQLEGGAFATSYIPNAGAAGTTSTRNMDVVVLGSTAFSSIYNTAAGTLFAQGIPRTVSGSPRFAALSDGTTNNREDIYITSTPTIGSDIFRAGAGVLFPRASGTPVVGTRYKCAITIGDNTGALCYNGGTPTGNGTYTSPTSITQLAFGSLASTLNPGNMFIERVAYFPTVLGTSALQALTT